MNYQGSRHSEILSEVRAACRARDIAWERYLAAIQAGRNAGIAVSDIARAARRTRQNVYALTVHPTDRARYRKESA